MTTVFLYIIVVLAIPAAFGWMLRGVGVSIRKPNFWILLALFILYGAGRAALERVGG